LPPRPQYFPTASALIQVGRAPDGFEAEIGVGVRPMQRSRERRHNACRRIRCSLHGGVHRVC